MIARMYLAWIRVANSLWALPIILVIAAIGLAVLAAILPIEPRANPVWWLYSGSATAAAGFLANLLTAMITMTTLAISITMVVLTLAAQSLGPRLIQIFMADTRTKLVLGLYFGTVVYLLIVLRSVVGDTETVPNLAVTLGAALVLASVVVLLFFVHHLASSIVADTIIDRVGATLDGWIAEAFPVEDNDASAANEAKTTPDVKGRSFAIKDTGYIQAIAHDDVVAAAREADAVVRFAVRPGHFVLRDDIVGWVTPATALDDDFCETILGTFFSGDGRTPVQDIEYPIRQLVEIALRALSPGINDPYTASAVIDRLAGSIAAIMARGAQRTCWHDEDDVLRLVVPSAQFDGILDAAFNEIRQAGASQPAVLIRLADRFGQLIAHAVPDQAREIGRHLELLRKTGERAIGDEADQKTLSERIDLALKQQPFAG